ncbi:DUF5615 family PIN-like protein [Tahibacter harae]|uniref:DUF5615 family PIN-like protein n=1 Tax=Tahibacter harae TaxID=2963937 RepID=A0ABT1QML2_9GAMM|nr:DUF5615 family PIN-like protein [Tahibacter harae]MCQ4163763.1 DUF5615 family PIN-like protein [Tahibacter harae]
MRALKGVWELRVILATKAALKYKAGFLAKGRPIILDENLSAAGMAGALRARGYNVRSVEEIYGRGGLQDPEILDLARSIDAKVLTRDKGRQIDGGFFEKAIVVDHRIRSPEAVARILEEGLK